MVDMENTLMIHPEIPKEGLIAFLSGKYVKGIGKVYATKIIEKVGENIFNPDFNFEDELKDIPGLGKNKIEDLKSSLSDLKYSPYLMAFLYSCGLSDSDIEKILGYYKKDTEKVILEDPYQMVEDVFKFSFFSADKIGKKMGIENNDPRRLRGALLTAIRLSAERGNMFSTEEEAVNIASHITGVTINGIEPEINNLIKEERIIKSHKGLYLPVYYRAEKESAEKIAAIIKKRTKEECEMPLPETDRSGNRLSKEQSDAIKTVMENPVTIITGGPGTGKTTTIRGVIELFEEQDKEVILAAPTGRAAKRLSDLAGREAKTIHRLLGYSQGKGYKNKKFKTDILIIDEASMLEQVLFNHLLQAIDDSTKIVLVGDVDQLPPIGAGDVLKDMIDSGRVPVVTLHENFRQSEGSNIASNALAIKGGNQPSFDEVNDFMIIAENSAQRIHKRLLKLVKEELPEKFQISAKEIQVVTPQKEGPLGSKQLNLDLQEAINPASPEINHGLKRLRLGDRVMQTVNSSSRNTYNGETGWVSDIDKEKEWLEVTFFDGKKSIYSKKEMRELSLAYATTVHKLQGSETNYMVMPMTMTHRNMLYRNLIYTGISRAKKLCVLVGEEKAIRLAVDNASPSSRNSNFGRRLRENLPIYPQK